MERRLTRISVTNLFGRRSYSLELSQNQSTLAIFYGDNGCGKTTIMRMVYHLLEGTPYSSNFTTIGAIPFSDFSVEFSDGTRIRAFRKKVYKSNAPYTIEVSGETANVSNTWKLGAHTGTTPDEQYLAICEVIREVGKPVVFFPAERRVHGAMGDKKADFQLVERHYRQSAIFSGDHYEEPPSPLVAGIREAESTLRQKVMNAQTSGYDSLNRIYLNVVRGVLQYGAGHPSSDDLHTILQRLERLGHHTEEFHRIGFTPDFDFRRFTSLISKSDSAHQVLGALVGVLRPFVDASESRLQKMQDTKNLVETFVGSINDKFLTDKAVSYDLQSGFSIRTRDSGDMIMPDDLSSGETQLLLMLVHLLCLRERNALLLVDEPELSLNIKWQRHLLGVFLDLIRGTDSQIAVATHSIGLFSAHRDYIKIFEEAASQKTAKQRPKKAARGKAKANAAKKRTAKRTARK